MRSYQAVLMAGALLLGACELPNGQVDLTRKHTSTPSIKPSVLGTPKPSTAADASPSPSTSASPSVPTLSLNGTVAIDASYVVSKGFGSIISVGGASVITAGGGNIISTGGGSIISKGGGSIISTGGGSVITAGGGNIISTGGGSVISAGGGNVISAGGGNVISAGGGNYKVLAAAPAVGTVLPVQGMVVVPLSLTTGQALGPAVFSDATGAYTLNVPEAQKDNVLIVAALPGKDVSDPVVQDPRVHYRLIVKPGQAAQPVIDEDSNVTTEYFRSCMLGRILGILGADDQTTIDTMLNAWDLSNTLKAPLKLLIQAMRDQAAKDGWDKLSEPQQAAIAQKLVDTMLATRELDGIMLDPSVVTDYNGPSETAKGALVAILKQTRVGTTALLQADAGLPSVTQADFFTSVNTLLPPAQQFKIEKASDFGDFFVKAYLSRNGKTSQKLITTILSSVNAGSDTVQGHQVDQGLRLDAAATCIIQALMMPMFSDQQNLLATIHTLVSAPPSP